MVLTNNHCITKSNRLIEACYRLSLEEQRVVLAAIATIDSRNERTPFNQEIQITISSYASTFSIDRNSAYSQVKKATDALFEREIKVKQPPEKGGGYKRMRWVSEVGYPEGQGYVKLRFSNGIEPFLYQLNNEFTSYKLKNVAGLRSIYSIRIYELIMQFKRTGERDITIDLFREMLDLGERYPMFSDLRKRVIQPAIKELNLRTDLEFSWEPVKKGKRIVKLVFTAQQQAQQALAL